MGLRDEITMFRREKFLEDMVKYQNVRPENHMYGKSLRNIIDGVLDTTERRNLIKQWFLQLAPVSGYVKLPVNRKWQFQTSDPDLKHLLSIGYLKVCRSNYGKSNVSINHRQRRSGCFQTYLTINTEKL